MLEILNLICSRRRMCIYAVHVYIIPLCSDLMCVSSWLLNFPINDWHRNFFITIQYPHWKDNSQLGSSRFSVHSHRMIFEVLDTHNLTNEKWKHKLLFDFFPRNRTRDHFTWQTPTSKIGSDCIGSMTSIKITLTQQFKTKEKFIFVFLACTYT